MLKRGKVLEFVKKYWIINLIVILVSAITIPFVIYFATQQEPYFITIDNDDDFEH